MASNKKKITKGEEKRIMQILYEMHHSKRKLFLAEQKIRTPEFRENRLLCDSLSDDEDFTDSNENAQKTEFVKNIILSTLPRKKLVCKTVVAKELPKCKSPTESKKEEKIIEKSAETFQIYEKSITKSSLHYNEKANLETQLVGNIN
jgi:hypothetical protein